VRRADDEEAELTSAVSVLRVREQLWALVKLWDLRMGREVG
jgi:hypothetical protein